MEVLLIFFIMQETRDEEEEEQEVHGECDEVEDVMDSNGEPGFQEQSESDEEHLSGIAEDGPGFEDEEGTERMLLLLLLFRGESDELRDEEIDHEDTVEQERKDLSILEGMGGQRLDLVE